MYSNKENINILTSLLVEWGVTDAVVCPGSRNAAIVHNLSECGRISCHPITDERSAAFYAMGMALNTKRPTVVCVTSGSALLNTAPAVAEAYYQHVPLIVISADRPQQWIDLLDGQTLPQPDALNRFVRRSVSLPEPRNEEERWYCNRLVNEAMHAATFRQPAPVLINVPITEPLFTFDTAELPEERRFRMLDSDVAISNATIEALQQELFKAKRPLIVVGQTAADGFGCSPFDIGELAKHFVVFAEPLSNSSSETIHFDEAVRRLTTHPEQQDGECDDASRYAPDYIIYIGDTLVSKATRRWLRQTQAPSCLVTADPLNACDPLMSLRHIVTCSNADLKLLMPALCDIYTHSDRYADNEAAWHNEESRKKYWNDWRGLLGKWADHAEKYEPVYSQMAAVRCLEQQIESASVRINTHYANSTAVRLACIYANHYVWCNRGVNGIEGSLSTAAGFAVASDDLNVCIIGDLSFFYDQNALWNSCVGGNLRILLLNNSCGGIFKQLPNLHKSPVADTFVGASHTTTAQGICAQNNVEYISAHNAEEMKHGISELLTRKGNRPVLLEVFTDAAIDAETLSRYFRGCTQ